MVACSIVIPLHNGASTIERTLDSVVEAAGGETIEVVVVDDRSADDGAARARQHRVAPRVITAEGEGRSRARNTGVRATTGEALVFLDADDRLLPGAVAGRLRALAAAGPDAIVVSRYREERGAAQRSRDVLADARRLHDVRLGLLRRNQLAIHCATVPRATLLRVAGDAPFEPDRDAFEDWQLWLRLAFGGVRFVPTDVEDCVYCLRTGMSTANEAAVDSALEILSAGEALARQESAASFHRALALREIGAARVEMALWRGAQHLRAGRGPGTLLRDARRVLAQGAALRAVPSILAARIADRRWDTPRE